MGAATSPAVSLEAVLRAQGADPARAGARPRALAARAIDEGTELLAPAVAMGRHAIRRIHPDRVWLADGRQLAGAAVAAGLNGAIELVAVALTVGPALDARIRSLAASTPAAALALDAFANAAALALADATRADLAAEAERRGLRLGPSVSPGLPGWPVLPAQRQLLDLLDAPAIGLLLLDTGMLRPVKSLTYLAGLGAAMDPGGAPCDACDRGTSCRQRPASAGPRP